VVSGVGVPVGGRRQGQPTHSRAERDPGEARTPRTHTHTPTSYLFLVSVIGFLEPHQLLLQPRPPSLLQAEFTPHLHKLAHGGVTLPTQGHVLAAPNAYRGMGRSIGRAAHPSTDGGCGVVVWKMCVQGDGRGCTAAAWQGSERSKQPRSCLQPTLAAQAAQAVAPPHRPPICRPWLH
jgi:hypothetical protein